MERSWHEGRGERAAVRYCCVEGSSQGAKFWGGFGNQSQMCRPCK